MKILFRLLPLFFLSPCCCFSQSNTAINAADTLRIWKKGGTGAINFSQAAFSNWAAGGENSVSAAALLNLFSNYKSPQTSWENSLDLAYAFIRANKTPLRKSDDKIDFTSKWGYKAGKQLFYAALLNFKSQFTAGYNYPNDSVVISDFLAPAFILVSTGIDYKPRDYVSFFVSPATGKITLVNNQTLANAGAYGVAEALFDTAGIQTTAGKKVRYEFGALVSLKFKREIVKNISLAAKANVFSNYFKDPQNMDVNADLLLNLKVNKYIAASISATLMYDHDTPVPIYTDVNGVKTQTGTGPRTQFKEVFAIGFSYKF